MQKRTKALIWMAIATIKVIALTAALTWGVSCKLDQLVDPDPLRCPADSTATVADSTECE